MRNNVRYAIILENVSFVFDSSGADLTLLLLFFSIKAYSRGVVWFRRPLP
jgi:hypothetical protein